MKVKMNIYDFVYGRCEAVAEKRIFLDKWFETKGNPCSKCGTDKSKCKYHNVLLDKGVFD